MLKCFFIKRKLTDYLDGTLTRESAEDVKNHLDGCPGCRRVFSQAQELISIAAQKNKVELTDEFWKKFDRDLNDRLDAQLGKNLSPNKRFAFIPFSVLPRPVLVAVPLALIVVAIGLHLLYPARYIREARIYRQQETGIVEDMELLDELSEANGVSYTAQDEDYIAEMDVLYLLDPQSIEGIG